ncbi:hypothetical protein IV454_29245 [Massilia antarctica]|uniref:Uncharacterized protein n=1 Tax=Massilia antarctica TaxID=2765360 RepID=A0AA48WCK4_9BURK|nr:hypothetical protein [Massilia antarctica]QPI49476.1 hypothetical protein IV454_29245 [Massilia antarctica]
MNRNLTGCCVLAAMLAGCHEQAAQARDATGAFNTMSCAIDGAPAFSASGKDVSVASLGSTAATVNLGLGMHAASIGRAHAISTGLVELPIAQGSYEFPKPGTAGGSGASYRIKNDANETLEDYTGSAYGQFYALAEQDPQARLVLDITRFQKLPPTVPKTQRLSIAGSFRFNAAYVAYVKGNLPDACATEALMRTMSNIGKPVSYPRYNPDICGAKRHRIECKFDVTENLMLL